MNRQENKKDLGAKGIRLGRVALMAALLSTSAFVPYAHANPEDGQVVGGSATISESGKKLDIHQHTHRTVIDWRSFNIDVDEHTEFHQPSSSATALNRVKSTDPSAILGKLTANGNIVLVNPNGVFFGRDSVVDVNGLVATTADIDTNAFMNGSNHFNIPGNPEAVIINEGTITAKEAGLIGLVAPNVENHGVIKAKMGRVQLASGDTVVADFYGDDLLKVEVTDENVKSQFVGNTGKLEAEDGTVAMTAAAARQTVNSVIVAKGELKTPSISKRGGKIIIGAAGSNKTEKDGASAVIVQASLDASGRDEGEQGGSIEVLGDHIAILDGTVMDASGYEAPLPIKPTTDNGTATMTADKNVRSEEDFLAHENRAGGSIKIGGDYLGKGKTQTAKTLYVGDYVLALNDAIDNGDAGRTIFWSDDTTDFNGLVLARGGANGGNGGFLETSGKVNLLANGFADLSVQYDPSLREAEGDAAIQYKKGTYLLDPQTITIYGNVDPTFVSTDNSIDLATPLQLWLDGNDIDGDGIAEGAGESGLVSGAGNCGSAITCVATWVDKSGKGNDATQGTAANRPQFTVGGQNGLDILGFDGGDYLSLGPNFTDLDMTDKTLFSTFSTNVSSLQGILDKDNNIGGWGFWTNGKGWTWVKALADLQDSSSLSVSAVPTILYSDIDGTASTWYYNGAYGSTQSKPAAIENPLTNYNTIIGGIRNGSSLLNGSIEELIAYNFILETNERNLVEQYQSAKWGIALDKLAGAGTEVAEATAHDAGDPTNSATNGYNVFTTDYLERLAGSADLMLQASTGITLDLKGDTLDLTGGAAAGKSITLQTDNGDITDVSSGTIRTTRTGSGAGLNGNISFIAGGAGNITLDTTNLEAQNGGQVSLTAGGGVTMDGTISGGSVFVQSGAGNDVTLNNTITASASGNALTIASGRNFINNAGAGALNTTDINGRWLVYSADPSANTLGGLTSDFKRYNKTYAGYAPGSVVETGDGLLYSIAPSLTVTAQNSSRAYGDANSFTYSISGFIDGDTQGSATSGEASLTSAATQNSNVGSYAIASALGTLASSLGYQFTTFNPATLSITKAPLSVSLAQSSYSRAQGAANPSFSLNYSGFKLGETSSVLDSLPSASTAAGTSSTGGQYAINISGGSDNNYSFSYPSPAGYLTVETAVLPSTWEKVAYANDGLNLGVQSPAPLVPTTTSSAPAGESSSSSAGANEDNDENGKPSVRRTQGQNDTETLSVPGLNVTIEASLARTLGLTQEKIDEMFQ